MKSEFKSLMFLLVLTVLLFFGGGKAHSDIHVSLPDTSGEHGDTIAIPIIVSEIVTEDSVFAFEMTLTFDSSVLTADSAYTTGTIAEGWYLVFNYATPGRIIVAAFGTNPLSGSGELVYTVFIVNGSQGDTTTIHFDEMLFNEGIPAAITKDGVFSVGPPGIEDCGDVNLDGNVDLGDVVYLINYLFRGGPPPCEP